jgi:hypothetical protein
VLFRFFFLFLSFTLFSRIAVAIDLSAYQRSDGAITVHKNGVRVDPYFSMKALWAARQLGDTAPVETLAWINWALPKQDANGSFSRFCFNEDRWEACAIADADDSTLALWIELLSEVAPRNMPAQWKQSMHRAEEHLQKLLLPSGIYRVNMNYQDGLLMDNSEIYYSLRRVAQLRKAAGDITGSQIYLKRSIALRLAMAKVFSADESKLLRWSSGTISEVKFYPHIVAHLFPLMHGMNTDKFGKMLVWEEWLQQYQSRWLGRVDDVFPWGLVALVAHKMKSPRLVYEWVEGSKTVRDSGHWSVLEESIYQGLARVRLGQKWQ